MLFFGTVFLYRLGTEIQFSMFSVSAFSIILERHNADLSRLIQASIDNKQYMYFQRYNRAIFIKV